MPVPSFSILIVEDDLGLRKTIRMALKKYPFHILEASDGVEAWAVFERTSVDAILLDALIPRIDGFEVCRRIRGHPMGADLPILMITGLDDPDSLDRAFAAGVTDFIPKPVNLEVLSRRLSGLLHARRVEGKLRRTKREFDSIFRAVPDAVLFTDPGMRIIMCNPAFYSLFGYAPEEAIDQTPEFLYARKEDYLNLSPPRLEGETGPDTIPFQASYRKKDKDTFPGETVVSPVINDRSMVVGAIQIIRDVTRRKNAEEERLKADKLAMMGVLASGIAHDLNNIITALMSNLSLLEGELPKTSGARDCLRDCYPALEQATKLARQLLTFSKGGEPIKKCVDPAAMVRNAVPFALRATRSTAEFDNPDSVWCVKMDEGQMVQAITNLVLNADQAVPDGGTITIALRNRELEAKNRFGLPPGPYLSLSVRDEGAGISRSHLPKIFDPYFTTKEKGSGLGLATVYSVVKRHRGFVEARSEPDKGSCFTLYLPASPESRPEPGAAVAPLKQGGGRILCLEDQAILRRALTRLLEEENYTVFCVESGAETLSAYKTAWGLPEKFDLVILDMTIPGGMGGLEVMRRLHAFDPEIKAIVSSGYSEDPVMAHPSRFGFKAVLPKPFNREELLRVVAEVLSE